MSVASSLPLSWQLVACLFICHMKSQGMGNGPFRQIGHTLKYNGSCVSDMRRDVQEIFRMTPHEKQVMMFSATLSKDIRPVCKKFMQDVIIERQSNWHHWSHYAGMVLSGKVCSYGLLSARIPSGGWNSWHQIGLFLVKLSNFLKQDPKLVAKS